MQKISDKGLYRLLSNFNRVLLRVEGLEKDKDWKALYGDMLVANEMILTGFTKEEAKAYELENRSH